MQTRKLLKKLFPGLVGLYQRVRVGLSRRRFRTKSVAETFKEVYRTNSWGAPDDGPFYSGHGSRNEFATRYAETVTAFIRNRGVSSVLDIGCGDFKVAELIRFGPETSYVGMDVVPELIEHHQRVYARPNVRFVCANAIEEDLPDAELCLIRQVLQHLSNVQIAHIVAKCRRYRYLLITEDVYVGADLRPNIDAPHGPDTRWFEKSGVFVDLPPFNLRGELILEIPVAEQSVLRSVLVER